MSIASSQQKKKSALGKAHSHRPSDAPGNTSGGASNGLKVPEHFVKANENPYNQVKWTKRNSQIVDADGNVVFQMEDVEVPDNWSQLATDIAVSKYFRRAGVPQTGSETSLRQLVHRVAHTIRQSGENSGGYFLTLKDADQFEKELVHILLNQKGAFNSPVWFNCGLYHEYGVLGSGGSWAWNEKLARPVETENSFKNPQCSACFIQSVDDDLMSIFDLLKNEARIFKYGSGTGSNFSKIRGGMENLSGGGTSSGLMSFLEVLDRAAGATKSGGTTRRAAKMVSLDIDHPEIEEFINWKWLEEKKAAALLSAGYSGGMGGEAYKSVSGQNSNNSVRIPDSFMRAIELDGDWETRARTDGRVIKKLKARGLWREIAEAAWHCADPGVQFDSTIQKWHTCPESGRISGSNPCSEYMFIDDSACNLSSINLMKFLREDGSFDIHSYRHTARILFIAQDILVDLSSYPTEKIAKNSHDFRPLGLGFANLGTLLMVKGIPYDSAQAVAFAGTVTALMHGEANLCSVELARAKGPFGAYPKNAPAMLKVMHEHQAEVTKIDHTLVEHDLIEACEQVWSEVLNLGSQFGFRNAQATVLAPTGTIGLFMDCDTTGIEPDFALVKFKKLAGGGHFKIVNQSVPRALGTLGYSKKQVSEIVEYAVGTMSLEKSPHINFDSLRKKGANEIDLQKISSALPGAFDLNGATAAWVLGVDGLARLGIESSQLVNNTVLELLGFSSQQIVDASKLVCGRMTLEGAPHLKTEHLAVFDCANKCGPDGERFIPPQAHLRMMAAAQKFLSGAISKTVNLPNESTVDDIQKIYSEAWSLGLKAVAVYRDGSKLTQPLSSQSPSSQSRLSGARAEGVASADDSKLYSQTELENAISRAIALAPARKYKLPVRRQGLTIEARVGGHKIFLRTGEYEDGRLGEIFIDMHKEGAALRSLLNCFAIAISTGLQYGVPLEDFVEKFTFTRFEPAGLVDHPNIKQATSIIDYIFRVLGMEYLGKTDFVHVQPAVENLAISRLNSERESQHLPNLSIDQLHLPMEKAALPGQESQESASVQHSEAQQTEIDPVNIQLSQMMGDAPMCSTCGHVTIRNGSCYRCLNCGNSMGCS